MLETELLKLVSFDNQNYPFPGCRSQNFQVSLEHYELNELQISSMLIKKEIEAVRSELNLGVSEDQIFAELQRGFQKYQYDPET